MHPADINAALKKAGTSQAHIARRLGVTHTAVCHVVNGRPNNRSRRIAKAISRATAIPMSTLWPNSYVQKAKKARSE
ncbi:MAG: helix-turn-helix domain-containing protein [Gammaproteobacteria bacterium]|nr:helix-turn-helix domain-containing protein [Gammaproteobacteria bacterium]